MEGDDKPWFTEEEIAKWKKQTALARKKMFEKKREDDSWKSEERRRPLRGGSLGIRTR